MKYKVYDGGYPLKRAHFDDAGIDIRTPEEFTLEPGKSIVIDTKVAVQIPIGYFGKLESKSGLNVNHCIITTGGVVDSGFRGTIKVRLYNFGDEAYTFLKGDKITQLVLIPVLLADLEQVDELDPMIYEIQTLGKKLLAMNGGKDIPITCEDGRGKELISGRE